MRWFVMGMLGCSIHGEAELVNSSCGDACPLCDADSDCVIAHNPCTQTAVCGHVDESMVVVQIACDAAVEYATPDASRCLCQADTCSAVDD
jgi:hypothetical protein